MTTISCFCGRILVDKLVCLNCGTDHSHVDVCALTHYPKRDPHAHIFKVDEVTGEPLVEDEPEDEPEYEPDDDLDRIRRIADD